MDYRTLQGSASLVKQFERRQKAFRPNLEIHPTSPYRVDAYLEKRYFPPDEDNCIEMRCFELPRWQKAHFQENVCCEDYINGRVLCTVGVGDYNNADGQDQDTSVSVCDDPDVTFGTIDPYENAYFDVPLIDDIIVCL